MWTWSALRAVGIELRLLEPKRSTEQQTLLGLVKAEAVGLPVKVQSTVPELGGPALAQAVAEASRNLPGQD